MANNYRITGLTDLKLLEDNAGSVAEVDFEMAKTIDFKSNIKTIEFEGDGTTTKKYYLTEVEAEIETDVFGAASLADIFGKTAVTGITGVAKRWYYGATSDSAGVVCGLKGVAIAEDTATGATKMLNVVVPRGTLSPADPPSLKTSDKSPMKLKFSSIKTAVDIAGDALDSVPSGGCHWYLDELS
jgi:hypothetical protein